MAGSNALVNRFWPLGWRSPIHSVKQSKQVWGNGLKLRAGPTAHARRIETRLKDSLMSTIIKHLSGPPIATNQQWLVRVPCWNVAVFKVVPLICHGYRPVPAISLGPRPKVHARVAHTLVNKCARSHKLILVFTLSQDCVLCLGLQQQVESS